MDVVPTELLVEIFALACTDNGHTGRSLSLVSAYFHDVVQPVQLQSISVVGLRQMIGFLKLLESKPRRVNHLLIADRIEDLPPFAERLQDQNSRIQEVRISRAAYVRKITQYYISILLLVAPHLHTFAIFLHFHDLVRVGVDYPGLIPVTLPCLKELTVHGKVSKQSFATSFQAPHLERLHIAKYVSLPEDVPSTLSHIAPNLTHLRISGVSAWIPNGNLLDALRSVANPSFSSDSQHLYPGLPIPQFSSKLQKVIIGQRVSYVSGTRSNPAYHSHTVEGLERLGMMCTDGRLVVLQIPPYVNAPGYWDANRSGKLQQTEKDWLERINGGEGCWDPISDWICVASGGWDNFRCKGRRMK